MCPCHVATCPESPCLSACGLQAAWFSSLGTSQVLQYSQSSRDVSKLTARLAAFFQIHFHDKLLFQTHDGLSPLSHMLHLGKQARPSSVSNPTRHPDNGHSSYSVIIIWLIKKAISRLCDPKGELLSHGRQRKGRSWQTWVLSEDN